MAMNDYLARLRGQLKGFTDEEQAALVEEIASHIESGQQENKTQASEGRCHILERDLGSPEELGRGFKAVYYPNRWLDFILAAAPLYLLFPIIQALIYGMVYRAVTQDVRVQAAWLDIRLEILVGLVMLGVSLYRRSPLLVALWAPDVVSRFVTLMTREGRWGLTSGKAAGIPDQIESMAYTLILLLVVYTLVKLIWKNRSDWLVIAFALTPFLQTLTNLAGFRLASAFGLLAGGSMVWGFNGTIFFQGLGLASLAGVFLLVKRRLRWAALALGYAAYSLTMSFYFSPRQALIMVWWLPLLVALAAWWADSRRIKKVFTV